METADDQGIKSTGEEAERLLDELERRQRDEPDPMPQSPRPGFPTLWIVLGSLAAGASVAGFVLAPYLNPPQPQNTKRQTSAPSSQENDFSPSAPLQQHEDVPPPMTTPEGAWGPASRYKFGQLPAGSYPDSCAFSQTDPSGQRITSRSTMEYWACRDEGGNPADGYSVTWADGKNTKYVFGPGGSGSVAGTNGETFPIRWQNDIKNGVSVVVVSHPDGATSWIPGRVD